MGLIMLHLNWIYNMKQISNNFLDLFNSENFFKLKQETFFKRFLEFKPPLIGSKVLLTKVNQYDERKRVELIKNDI